MDYEVIENEGEWQVWMPNITGACIGSGPSRPEALVNCALGLRKAADRMADSSPLFTMIGPRHRYQHIGHWTAFFNALLAHWGDPISAADYADDSLAELLARIPQLAQPAAEDINPVEAQQ